MNTAESRLGAGATNREDVVEQSEASQAFSSPSIAHPTGREYLARDARNVASWFAARGQPGADPDELALRVAEQAGRA